MSAELALEILYDAVRADFAANEIACDQPFGWRAKARQLGDPSRIVWIPGAPRGELGEIGGARYPGREDTRPLLELNERFHVVISAKPPDEHPEELGSWRATRLLFDEWVRAVWVAAHTPIADGGCGPFQILSAEWDRSKTEGQRGATLTVVCAISAMIPDESHTHAPANAHAEITTTANGTAEIDTAPEQA